MMMMMMMMMSEMTCVTVCPLYSCNLRTQQMAPRSADDVGVIFDVDTQKLIVKCTKPTSPRFVRSVFHSLSSFTEVLTPL